MASSVSLLIVLELATLGLCNHCPETTGFCSQVYQMQRFCSGLSPGNPVVIPQRGKAGLPGRKGDPGEAASVDYDAIDEKINTKFQELESRVDALEKNANKTERLRKRLINECIDKTREDAISWYGNGGIFNIFRYGKKYEVYCDLTTDGGGWMVFQRRINGSVNFHRNWDEYVSGFGDKDGEFWMGLEDIYELVHGGDYELRIDLTDWDGESAYAKYRSFSIGDASAKYRLSFGTFSGNAGNGLNHHNNRKFTTKDQDNDDYIKGNCAQGNGGGWWFGSCDSANLNGIYRNGGSYSGTENGVEWDTWRHNGQHYSMKSTEMKLRPMT